LQKHITENNEKINIDQIVEAFEEELERSKEPGYKPVSLDDEGDNDVSHLEG